MTLKTNQTAPSVIKIYRGGADWWDCLWPVTTPPFKKKKLDVCFKQQRCFFGWFDRYLLIRSESGEPIGSGSGEPIGSESAEPIGSGSGELKCCESNRAFADLDTRNTN